tara:strand:- start:3113 stop:3493 length:381 start_codon:yes stop_codon:yes gene_type:complete
LDRRNNMIEVRKIKTKEEYDYVRKEAIKNGFNISNPSHVLYDKDGNVVGGWSLGNTPLVIVWSHTDRAKRLDSMYHNETLAALMDEKGYTNFYIACDNHSPYYKYMEKFGYKSLNWSPSMFMKDLK